MDPFSEQVSHSTLLLGSSGSSDQWSICYNWLQHHKVRWWGIIGREVGQTYGQRISISR